MTYKVGVIEDDDHIFNLMEDIIDDFYFVKLDLGSLENFIPQIVAEKLDAIIIDFNLSNIREISYTGDDVLQCIHDHLMDFPAVILTGYGSEAEKNNESPYIVYNKDEVMSNDSTEFNRRLSIRIEGYKQKIDQAKDEHSALINKRDLSPADEVRILKLDDFLERTYNGNNSLVSRYKETKFEKNLTDLIENTEKLIEKINQ